MAIKGKETGEWHVDKVDGRFWFITPEGNAFYALGINHLPGADTEKSRRKVAGDLENWGFNTAGHNPPYWLEQRMPSFAGVSLHDARHWMPAGDFKFTDVFSDAYTDRVEKAVQEVAERCRDNPLVIGYSLTDTPRYHLDITRNRRGSDWVSFTRELDASAKGKQRYVAFLRERYDNDLNTFRSAYRLPHVGSFEALLAYDFFGIELARPLIRADDEAFLLEIVRRIYQLTRGAFDRHDPDKLVLSERFKMHDHNDEIIRIAGEYTDVISVQPGPTKGPDVGQGPDESEFNQSYWKRLYELTGKPAFICDHACTFPTPGYPRTLWHQFETEEKAGEHYREYLEQTAAEPYIVGYQRCQYKSRYDPLRTLLKQGLLDREGKPYEKLVEFVEETNRRLLGELYRSRN